MSSHNTYHQISGRELNRVISDADGYPVVVIFTTEWSGESILLESVIHRIAEDFPDTQFFSIDIEEEEDLAYNLGVSHAPTTMVNCDGEWVDVFSGVMNRRRLIERLQNNSCY